MEGLTIPMLDGGMDDIDESPIIESTSEEMSTTTTASSTAVASADSQASTQPYSETIYRREDMWELSLHVKINS